MKITFLLPDTILTGGVKIVFKYANRLKERGHEVLIIVSPPNSQPTFIKKIIYRIRKLLNLNNSILVDWFDLKTPLIQVPTFEEKYIPDSDIIVATWWETANYVSKYKKSKGEKFYFIQHYEVWGGPKEEVNKTYKLGLHNIVISSWLKEKLEDIGANIEALILNGFDFNEFYPEKKDKNTDTIRILTPYRTDKWKGVNDALKAFELVKKDKNVQLIMFGHEPSENELPNYVEFHLLPVGDKLRKLYNSCDIFLFPSHCEGFGLPPFEAMACKLPVVTTDVGAIKDCTIPGKTTLVSKPGDIDSLAQNLIKLIDNPDLRIKIAESGYEHIKKFDFDKSTDKLENLFKKYFEVNNA
ncbi:MAG: glycosyltransferase family 4 protein [Methanobacterium sp.]|jgi:glycosyltransferase involved in cell wall biosynthesis